MKKSLPLLTMVFTLSLATVAMDAEASRRLGGGQSMGMQRPAVPDRAPTANAAPAPATNPTAAAAPATATGAAGAAGAATSGSRWMAPVAGLAAGLGIAALAAHLGFGAALANLLMIGLLVLALLVAVGLIMRRRAAAQGPMTGRMGGMQYAAAGGAPATGRRAQAPTAPTYKMAWPATGGSGIGSGLSANRIPADFDTAAFVRNAKVNFIRLQAANDAGNLDDIRQFTTPEMFAELKMNLSERATTAQHTDVLHIDGEVLEVEEDANRYLVSVRFTGETRESGQNATESFDEIWHLTRPRQGQGGWVLAGLQQMQ